jgi:nanoRNase/pAp phosphatase (c-di-AMP/oligoRNAs hydrolase)
MGHSVVNRTSKTKVGQLLLKYSGGGHDKVGTCQVPYDKADKVLTDLVTKLKSDG